MPTWDKAKRKASLKRWLKKHPHYGRDYMRRRRAGRGITDWTFILGVHVRWRMYA